MAITALYSSSTGMNALSTQIDVIANNLANVNTTGFKSSRVNFEDLVYQELQQPGVENENGDQRPAGIFVGLGTRVANTDRNMTQGSPINTGRDLDVFIDGEGFFKVDIIDREGSGIGFTRSGNFFANSEGELVLGNSDGPRLVPPLAIPADTMSVTITNDGHVMATVAGDPNPQDIGQIELANFINANGLRPIGGNIFVETAASGPAIEGAPGEGAIGTLEQGFLESSNVDPVNELIGLIQAQRGFELNSQVIQAADQTLQVVSNLRRF